MKTKLNLLAVGIFLAAVNAGFGQPVITNQPQNQTAIAGATVTFSVGASGTAPLSYQWRSYANPSMSTNIPFGTEATLVLTNVQPTSRRFGVEVSNASGSVTSVLATLTVTSSPPFLVSASSVNGAEIGLCFSREMNPTGLSLAGNYQVVGSAGSVAVASVLPWPGNTSVVLRLSAPVSGSFRVSAQAIRDLAGTLVSSASVTGQVWAQPLALERVGSPALPSEFLTCVDGQLTVRGEGGLYGGPSHFDFLHELRTNDFDVQVRVDSIRKPTAPSSTGLDSPLVAEAGLMVYNSSNPAGPSLALVAMPTNGSRMFMFRLWDRTTNSPVQYPDYTWGASSEGFPIWLRIRRAGSSFRSYYSTNGTDWTNVGDPVTLPASAIMQVGLVTVSFVSGVYATAEFRDYGDTRLNPGAIMEVTHGPADVTVEENHSATFTAQASVSGVSEDELTYQWQTETAPGSGQFTNVFLGNSPRYVTPLLNQADSGLRVRLLARISGGPSVVSAPARVTVTPDQTPPRVLSAKTRRGWNSIVVTFSEPITPATGLDSFNYSGSDFAAMPIGQDATGSKVTLSLSEPLDLTSSHELTVAGIDDLAGNSLLPIPTQLMVTEGTLQRGAALQELYFGVSSVSSLRYSASLNIAPDSQSLVSQLEGPLNFADNYGTRLSGFLIPPVSGSYHFWMCSDDEGEFWLSTDHDPANLQMLCHEPSWNSSRQFNTLARRDPTAPENRSSSLFPAGVPLIAGQRYYLEALAVEGLGGDNLAVAWQVPGSLPPQDGGAPISAAFLAFLGDSVDTTIQVTQQPGNATARSLATGDGAARTLFHQDFNLNNGGFTTAQSGNPMGAWTYDGASGVWFADGSDNFPPSEKVLNSPPITVTQAGELRLRLQHRFTFQEGMFDGGQVRISLNGGLFSLVPATAFTTNGYGGVISSDFTLFSTPGFGNTSPGYANGEYIASEASLGVFSPGDRLAIQFRGLWDWSIVNPGPGWVINSLELTEGHPGRTEAIFAVQAEAIRSDNGLAPLSYAWQRDCGTGFVDISGANEAIYRFVPSATDNGCRYRCLLFTPGATATSEVATLTLVLPAITITRNNADVILNWTEGVLQEAETVTGLWTDVPQATSPTRLTTASARRFFRLRAP